MKITVFGASGRVGQVVVQKLLDNGHKVVAFVHGGSPFKETAQLAVIRGDIRNREDVLRAVRGSDSVVSTLGSWGTKSKDILSRGAENIIAAMYECNVKRIVSLTGADAVLHEEKKELASRMFRLLILASPARRILLDGEKHLRLLSESSLDWTVLRSPVMNEKGAVAHQRVDLVKPKPWVTINRNSVADAIIDLIPEKQFFRKAPYIKRHKPRIK